MYQRYQIAREWGVEKKGRELKLDVQLSLNCQTRPISLAQLSTVSNDDGGRSLAALGSDALDGFDNVHALDDLAEDHVLAVQPLGLHRAQEELRAVRVRASICHGENSGAGVLLLEVLVSELLAVDGLSTGAVSIREISALAHEVRDHTVEFAALEVERFALLAHSLLSSAQGAEVLGGLRHDVGIQLHDDSAGSLASNRDVEEHLRAAHFAHELTT